MLKNTIFIVIDSIYYDKTITTENHVSPMPFLEKLRSEGVDHTNMYSEAPYTEAALVSLLCGTDTLKNGGYLKKLYGCETVMETFKNNGYDTFCNCVQPLVYPSYSYQGLTDEYYNICYDFQTLWSYRLDFYSKKNKEQKLDKKTIKVIADLLEDNLYTWEKFLNGLLNKDEFVSFIYPYVDITGTEENLSLLEEEIKKFESNKEQYTIDLLEQGKEHKLFKLKVYMLSKPMSEEEKKKIYDRYKKVIRKIQFTNTMKNLKNNHLVLTPKEERKDLFKAYLNAIYNRFLYSKIDYKSDERKNAPSMHTTFLHFESWLLNRKSNKPYFAYIHLDDCHRQEFFHTYDTNDFNLLDEEFDAINNYIDNLPKKYRGNLTYDLSLQYADNCLRKLYEFLKEKKMLDNVNIVVCADHGSSYTFDPYRSNYVNNVHRENYNMPFVIWNNSIKHEIKEGFYNTKDIPATILDLNNLKIPKMYDGISTLKSKGRKYVLLENVNGGCPDYNLRDILLGVRDDKYVVVMNLNVHKPFSEGEIHSIYDLQKDKEELYNLKNDIDKSKIKYYLEVLEKEFNELQKNVEKTNFIN